MKNFLRFTALFACIFFFGQRVFSQQAQNLLPDSSKYYLLRPYQIFDGKDVLKNTWVLIKGNEIKNVGPSGSFFFPANTVIIDMPNQTLMPGLIDGHTHLFLHLYNEASYETQVMRESGAERVLRAASNARKALMSGFTTVVDMGTLGAGFEDEGLQETIEKGVVSGPRMLIASRGISASGAYSSKGFANETEIPKGAATADGKDDILKEIRNQLGAGADIIYVYCESFGSKGNPATATYTVEELQLIVDLAKSANRIVVANASTPEGIKRAIDAGITFITHADNCTPELLKLMKEKNVILCPTVAHNEVSAIYYGWKRGIDKDPERVAKKKEMVDGAVKLGMTICFGSDAGGVIAHGKNYLEMELLADYGMNNMDVLKAATSGNADIFGLTSKVGRVKEGLLGDLIAVDGDPTKDVSKVEQLRFIMKDGIIYKNDLDK